MNVVSQCHKAAVFWDDFTYVWMILEMVYGISFTIQQSNNLPNWLSHTCQTFFLMVH